MFDYEVEDCRLQHFLKDRIRRRGCAVEYRLKNLVNCGAYGDKRMGVHILANGTHSKVLGIRTCNNTWVCPYCTARMMSKYAAKIDAAIQALKELENLVPVMVTMTVFHTCEYSAGEMFDLLTKAYSLFNRYTGYSKKTVKIEGKDWTKKEGSNRGVFGCGATANFLNTFNIKHKIKASEVTYGQHGWHPHYHMLYFVKKSDLDNLAEWEPKLLDYWNKCVNRAFCELFPERWESWSYLFKKYLADETKTHKGLYFSKDANGKVTSVDAAQYCCGFDIHWDASKELTGGSGNEKVANPGHYTPRQMLELAYAGDTKFEDKYIELATALANRRQHRVEFSRTGIRSIIINWMNSQGYKEYVKKKNTETLSKRKIQPFYTVCWFSSVQWSEICNKQYDYWWLIVLIRRFAICEDVELAFQLICELMEVFELSLPARYPPFDISDAYNSVIRGDFDEESKITALDVWKKTFTFKNVPELVPLDLTEFRAARRAPRAAAALSA